MKHIPYLLLLLFARFTSSIQAFPFGEKEGQPISTKKQTLFKGGHIFDTSTGVMSRPRDILIERDIITKVGLHQDGLENVPTIDCSGKYVLRGLFDCHTHLAPLTLRG